MARYRLINGDCLEVLPTLERGSAGLVLCDPPYGTTACAWDAVIPFEPMWAGLRHVARANAAMVFTSSQPFTSSLGASNIGELKYAWVWEKNRPTGHVHAKNKPMKKHEDVIVFSSGTTVHASQSKSRMIYNPQGLNPLDVPAVRRRNNKGDDTVLSQRKSHRDTFRHFDGFPSSIVAFDSIQGTERLHPTQKPLGLMEYLVLTYSNIGDTVLDFTMGSGTTGVACMNTGRNFIGIEKDSKYFSIAENRIAAAAEANSWVDLI